MDHRNASLKYINGIDGLRALAVISIILYHLNPQWLPGGFIGVDLFFVISGFLITRIIFTELQNNTFTVKSFYKRRIKRIFPALFFMLFISMGIVYLIFIPQDIKHFNRSLLNTLFFWSNHYFAGFGSYFAPKSYELPLLHTWSLSVEEQFYFIWPLVLWIIYSKFKNFLWPSIFVVIILSFGGGAYILLKGKYLTYVYYALPTRAGQLLMGASLSLLIQQGKLNIPTKKISSFFLLFGLLILNICLIFLNDKSPYPGINGFIVSLGSSFLIYSTLNTSPLSKILLENTTLRYIGKLSYSLYLWHWPILTILRYIWGEQILPVTWNISALFIISFFSLLSFYTIETPIRKSRLGFKKTFIYFYLLPTIILCGGINTVRYFEIELDKRDKKFTTYGGKELCHGRINASCTRGDLTKKPKTLLIGDSHAAHLNYFFDELGKKNGFSVDVVSASSCPPLPSFDEKKISWWAQKDCKNIRQHVAKIIGKYDKIVIAFAKKTDQFYEILLKDLKKISHLNKDIFIINPIKRMEKKSRLSPYMHNFFGLPKHKVFSPKIPFHYLSQIQKIKNIGFIDLNKYIERPYVEDKFLYMDKNHLNKYGAMLLSQKVLPSSPWLNQIQ